MRYFKYVYADEPNYINSIFVMNDDKTKEKILWDDDETYYINRDDWDDYTSYTDNYIEIEITKEEAFLEMI